MGALLQMSQAGTMSLQVRRAAAAAPALPRLAASRRGSPAAAGGLHSCASLRVFSDGTRLGRTHRRISRSRASEPRSALDADGMDAYRRPSASSRAVFASSVTDVEPVPEPSLLVSYAQKFTGLGLLLAVDKALKTAFEQAGWNFPAPLAGMFIIIAVLQALDMTSPKALRAVEAFFAPALAWISRWVPLFFVPSLVMLPIILKQVPSAALAKLVGIVTLGMVMSLVVTAQVAVVVRAIMKTKMAKMGPPSKPLPPPQMYHRVGWGAVAVISLVTSLVSPSMASTMAVPFLLSGTVGGYLIGLVLPVGVKKILHPVITTCLVGIASAGVWGAVTGVGFEGALMAYKTPTGSGAGDILMGFLGIVILSFGFSVFSQRALMVRHRYEILGCTLASAIFSLFSTVVMGRIVGLEAVLSCAIAPRAVTVALALPIAQQLQAAALAGVTAAAVCFEGLIGTSLCQPLLTRLGYKDPIVRGMGVAGAAHGLGTAGLAANEPDALPFCALACALIGIQASLVSCLPAVRIALMSIAGMPTV